MLLAESSFLRTLHFPAAVGEALSRAGMLIGLVIVAVSVVVPMPAVV